MNFKLARMVSQKSATARIWKGRCIALSFILVTWLIWTTTFSPGQTLQHHVGLSGKFGNLETNSYSDIQKLVALKEELEYLKLSHYRSPFKFVTTKQKQLLDGKLDKKLFSKSELNLLKNWHSSPKSKQCSYLIAGIYDQFPDWNNMDMFNYYEENDRSNSVFELIVERLRIYDYCFLDGDSNTTEVFQEDILDARHISVEDYNIRMFPLFNIPSIDDELLTGTVKTEEVLWPNIYDLDPSKDADNIKVSLPHFLHEIDVHEYNMNFWKNWLKFSTGKGIVTTMRKEDLPMFKRLVTILKRHDNKLPIQIVTTGEEMDQESINYLLGLSKQSGQRIQIVDCTPIINKFFSDYKFHGFLNKFSASLFNTFEEAILIDVDVVPFISPIEFFDIERYKDTGMYLYRDRRLDNLLPNSCRTFMGGLEPSIQEKQLIGTKIKYDKKWSTEHKGIDSRHLASPEDVVYKSYMHDQEFHVVDSGLVIFNKKKHFASLLMSTYLGFDYAASGCSWGDKELFWLGSIYGGGDFAVAPKEGAIVGELQQDAQNQNKYSICSAQLAHVDDNNKLVWINGGLKTCKFEDEARYDFHYKPEYFTERYGTVEKLQALQNESITINAVIVPDVYYSEWLRIDECRGYTYCYTLDLASKGASDYSYIVKYSAEQYDFYNEISTLWSSV